jgi:hypothetical protein
MARAARLATRKCWRRYLRSDLVCNVSKEGTDWTADEIAVLVGGFLLMLAEERGGRDYIKHRIE